MRPDYEGGSIVNLMASIETAFGGRSRYQELRGLAAAEIAAARNLCLIVVDGLGARYLARAQSDGALQRHARATITSTFPTTTATAITTFMTGLAPQQHGLTGWHMYFRELGTVLAVLPFRPRHGGPPIAGDGGVTPAALLRNPPFADRLDAAAFVVSPSAIVDSVFNVAHSGRAQRIGHGGVEQLFGAVRDAVRGSPGRTYVYAYYSEIDSLAHAHGIGSAEVQSELGRVDAAFGRLLEELAGTDTLVVATADHGFVDTRPETVVDLDDHPPLAATLAVPLCGEPRVAYCYVKPGHERAFERHVETRLAHCASLVRSADLLAQGWFGPGAPHPRLADRIGDYALVMKDGYAIRDHVPGERRHLQIGVHGGTSEDEMLVPLVVARA
jgi:predicted AlkP superfamily pyrophosphatase or phosphodiesterase